MAFSYTSGNPNNLVGGQPAAMVDIRGPFLDLSTYLNSLPAPAAGPSTALSNITVSEVGISGQVRAGRQLASTDFTNQGLSVPIALWNLGDLTDASGNGRALTNKGSVPFGVGINGTASTAAVFAGSTGQALYIADTGAADPFRIKTGSWGCWMRTAKRGVTTTYFMSKASASAGQFAYFMGLNVNNQIFAQYSTTGSDGQAVTGTSDVCDDRWHFIVVTVDGTAERLYVDGALEARTTVASLIFGGSGPLNIGGYGADGSTATTAPHYGRVDEAFVTNDVLSEDQIRALYSARIPHTLAQVPGDTRVMVRRRKRGGTLATTDFPTTPVRLHNFTAGSLADEGSGGVAVVAQGTTTGILDVAGADGLVGNAKSLSGAHQGFASTDAGLPAALTTRSYGCWLKSSTNAVMVMIGWGTLSSAHAYVGITTSPAGAVFCNSGADQITGPLVADGLWHHVAVVEDNAAGDGVRRKLYVDGRLAVGSTVLNTLTLAGANRFRVGAAPDGTLPFTGQIDGAFVHSVAFTGEQVRALYNKGTQALNPSPKDAADHVEAVTTADVLAIFDSIEASDSVDLTVGP